MAGAFQTSGRMQGEDPRGPIGYIGEKFIGENPYNPEAGQINTQQADAERFYGAQIGKQQGEFSNYLRDAVAGQGPTVAGQQMAAGRAQAIQAARSQAASARGGNVALANRMGATGQAQAIQGANRDAAMLRAQEQISREQLLMQQQQNQRIAELQARGLSIDQAKAQLAAETAAMQARTTISEGEANRGTGPGAALMGAVGGLLASSDIRAKEDIRPAYGERLHEALSMQPQQPMMAGNVVPPPPEAAQPPQAQAQGGGTAGNLAAGFNIGQMLSDARAKAAEQHVRSLSEELDKLRASMPQQVRNEAPASYPSPEQSRQDLEAVQPYTYRYKPEAAAAMGTDTAPRAGVMAQDLQKSPAYQASVVNTPQGLALDKERLLSANTAELGGLDKRLKDIEDQLKGKASYPTPRQPEAPSPKAVAAR